MSESEVEKVEMPSSGDSDTDEWLKMEARFRDEGQAYGLKGLDLLKYVQDLLAQAKERRQRFEEREERVRQQEAEEIRLRRQHELEMYKVREGIYPKSVRSEGDTVERKNVESLKLEVPKFDKQEVVHESRSHSLCVGDVVLVVDDQSKRSMWKLGVILDLFPGRDGRSRVSKIKVGNREFLRPVQRLVPLEVSSICSTATEPQIVAPEVPAATEAEEPVTAVPCAKQTRTRAVRSTTRLDL